jgi:hypothetical protein
MESLVRYTRLDYIIDSFFVQVYLFYLPFIYSVPKAGVCTGGAPNAPVRLQDCCKQILFLFLFLKSLKKNFILFCSLDL